MKKVFLYAYDKQNLGDDLFVQTIAKRYPNTKFYMWSEKSNKRTFNTLKNVKIIAKDSYIFNLLNSIHSSLVFKVKTKLEISCDVVVFIAGSIFIEYDEWQQILTWWDYESKNRNFYVIGVNFGPYKTEAYRTQLSEIFANLSDVCFRDKYSYELFSDIHSTRYAPDILFGINMPCRQNYKKRVFISVIDCKSKDEGINQLAKYEKKYLNNIITIIKRSIENEYYVTLSSFCKAEGDENAISKLLKCLNTDELEYIAVKNYNGTNSMEILQEISNSDLIVATRFHAMILGFAADKSVLPFIYSNKTRNVLNDIGFSGKIYDIRNEDELELNINTKFLEKQRLDNINKIKAQSNDHFSRLDLLL